MANNDDTPLLTRGQVERWKARDRELEMEIIRLGQEQRELHRKLEAAAVFLGDEPQKTEVTQVAAAKPSVDEPSEGLGDAITRIAALYGKDGALPGVIRKALITSGYDMTRFNANPGYFYTVMGRLLQRGKLEKRRNGAYRVPAPASSPEGETGAVAAPVSSSTH
jgi:hypothetical protein